MSVPLFFISLMIRKVCMHDAAGIAAIYNEYVEHTTISFEISAVSVGDMRSRIDLISKNYPFFCL